MARRIVRGIALALGLVALGVAGLVAFMRGPLADAPNGEQQRRPVSAERLERDVRHLVEELTPRWYRPPEHLDRAADWVRERMEAAGFEVLEVVSELPEGSYRNLVARRPGTDPDAGAILVGAHYDAYGDLPGADDNASGVARDLLEREIGIDLMIALDLVGYYSDEPGSQRLPAWWLAPFFPTTGNFVGVIGDVESGAAIARVKGGMRATARIPVVSFRAPRFVAGVDWSDHFWFRKLGVPAVLVTDTAMMRNPNYHRRTDTPDTLDYERMAEVVQGLHGVLAAE